MNLLIQESWVNRTRGYLCGETEPYESRFTTPSEAYRGCRKLYGRCTGRVYVDGPNGHDAQGIPLCRVCSECRAEKLSRYRPEILSGYDQSDVDEPIEPDGYYGQPEGDW